MASTCCVAPHVSGRTCVVHVRKEHDVYIGRAMPGRAASPFANPFRSGKDGTRSDVIAMYRVYILERLEKEPELRQALEQLRGKRIACWCKPLDCHGDVLVELLEGPPPAQPVQLGLF